MAVCHQSCCDRSVPAGSDVWTGDLSVRRPGDRADAGLAEPHQLDRLVVVSRFWKPAAVDALLRSVEFSDGCADSTRIDPVCASNSVVRGLEAMDVGSDNYNPCLVRMAARILGTASSSSGRLLDPRVFCFGDLDLSGGMAFQSRGPRLGDAMVAGTLRPDGADSHRIIDDSITPALGHHRHGCTAGGIQRHLQHLYFVVTVSMFLEEISFSRLRRFLAVPFILWAVMCTALGLLHRYDTARASGLRQCSEELRKLSHPGEPVFVASSFYTPPLQWYLQGAADVYLLQPIEDLKHYQGRAIIDADEIRSLSEQALEGVDRFWCVVDERMSQTIRNPGTVAIPAGWRVVRKRQYIEANRLPTPLELWEVVRTSEVRQQKSVSRDDRD